MEDVLANVSVAAVAAWYRRLAEAQIKAVPELQPALAGAFLLKWLDNRNRNATYAFDAPHHLKTAQVVADVQAYHRNVFMTYQKGRVGSNEKWVGILPRLQGAPDFTKWDMLHELELQYESLCDIALNLWDINRIQKYGSSSTMSRTTRNRVCECVPRNRRGRPGHAIIHARRAGYCHS